jgi:hypothetical protein
MNTIRQKINSSKSVKLLGLTITAALLGASNYGQGQAIDSADFALPEKIAFESEKAAELAAMEGLKVVYHGSDEFNNKMLQRGLVAGAYQEEFASKAVAGLDESASNQIVILESTNKDQALFERLLARGNVIISVGGANVDASRALNSVFNANAGFSKGEGIPSATDKRTRYSADLGDGKIVYIKVSAYRFAPYGSESFTTMEQNETLAIAQAILWARDLTMKENSSGSLNLAKATGQTYFARNHTYTCKNSNDTTGGTVTNKTEYAKISESYGTNDYWRVKLFTSTTPAANWKTYDIRNRLQVNSSTTSWNLLDYDPTTTAGTSQSQASVSLAAAGLTFGSSWTYVTPLVTITDGSYGETMFLIHDIASNSPAATTTYKITPGALISVGQNATNVWNGVAERVGATFKRRYSADANCNVSLPQE